MSFDIRRSILLGKYIDQWGLPLKRTISTKEGNFQGVEVYEFPPKNDGVYRFVTIGLSCQTLDSGVVANWEFLFCLPDSLGSANSSLVVNYLLDIMGYSLRAEVDMKVGVLIPVSSLAPDCWSTKAILVDEARGEAKEMSSHCIGNQNIELLWLIPITSSEYELIKNKGIEEFDQLEAKCGVSLLDVNRDGIV